MRVGCHIAEGNRVVSGTFNLAAGKYAGGVAVNQQAKQDSGMMGLRASASVLLSQLRQVELVDHVDNKTGQVILGQPILHGGRKQVISFPIRVYEICHHCALIAAVALIIPRRYCSVKFDRLLAGFHGNCSKILATA